MDEYQVKEVVKDEQGYHLTYEADGHQVSKNLPVLEGFEPRVGDTLSINRRSKGETDVSLSRGESLLADFHVDRKAVRFNIYREEGVDKYASGMLQPNAIRRAKKFADKCSKVLETKMGPVKFRQALAAAAFLGVWASLGTDPDYAKAVNLAPEEFKSPEIPQLLVCGATLVGSAVKGFGREVLDAAARKWIEKRGINVYGSDGKVTKIVAGLDRDGNPTGSFFNKNLMAARGGRNA